MWGILIGTTLHEIMNNKNLTLQELADLTDIPIDTIKNLYYGKVKDPKVSTLLKLSQKLNLTMDYLMGYSHYNEEEQKIILCYRKCGHHGKSMMQIISRFEMKAAEKQRNMLDRHIIPCLIPIGKVTDGIVYNSCNMIEIETGIKQACLAIEVTTNYFAPSYCKGDRILFANRFPENNERAVFTNGYKCYFRRFIDNNGSYVLKCLNGIGRDMILKRMDEMECIGTCVGVIRT